MTDFRVVPQALRTQATELQYTSDHYLTSSKYISENRMGEYVLGVYGRDVVDIFNNMLVEVEGKLKQTQTSIKNAADNLALVANTFENHDYEYYAKFGYQNESLGN